MAKALSLSYTSFVVALSGGLRTGQSFKESLLLYHAGNVSVYGTSDSLIGYFVLETRPFIFSPSSTEARTGSKCIARRERS
jgi:hypothetical protein